jgi:protease I
MANELRSYRIAILATDGVEQVELTDPRNALEQAGAQIDLISLKPGQIQGFNHLDKGDTFPVDRTVADADASDYDGLLLPGGVANPDTLRTDQNAVQFVRDFFAAKKPVAAICHGPWMLVESDVVRHRTVTSWPSLRTDITNAGGCWVDEEVHVDKGLVTSRNPSDLPAFCAKMIEEFAEGTHRAAPGVPAEYAAVGGRHDVPEREEDEAVDVASAESFPASDPPSSLKVT